ncbi:MAG TPA: SDR family NAD(P)-dependent oxidoreductase [Ktedonobacteraceae bacterium]|nr:SDR family NAD(P)-dependent oxidoreductase [Ktedonobacteraceae bacterium]
MAIPDVSEKSIAELISLKGRNAVVTGGARGIGLAICKRLAEAGANIVVGDVREDIGKEAAEHIAQQWGVKALFCVADVSDGASIAQLADKTVQELGGINIWVNNAGIYPFSPVVEMSDEQWDRVLNINLRGTFIGAREAAKRMIVAQKGGVIINLASTAGYQGGASIAHYVASKHGVRGLTKSLAIELGPHNIRVLALAPTLISTPGISESGLVSSAFESQPLGRVGVPDDVGRVALFCASDLSMLMTGSTIAVDAGALTA